MTSVSAAVGQNGCVLKFAKSRKVAATLMSRCQLEVNEKTSGVFRNKPEVMVCRTGCFVVVRGLIVVLRLRELLRMIQPRRVHLRNGTDADIRQLTSGIYEKLDQRRHDNPAPRNIELRVARQIVLL